MPRPGPGRRRFAPSLAATLAMLAGVALLLWLGAWQLGRAAAARAQLEAYARGDTAPVALPPAAAAGALPRYARVRLAGRYLPAQQFLLDNMTHGGTAGYRVLTPFVTDGGETVLVDRGWLPLGASRATLPAIAVGAERRELSGRVDALPRPGLALGAAPGSGPWPRVVGFPGLAELGAALGRTPYPWIVLLDAGAPDGYLRDWRPVALPPERHLGYAVEWFALALTLLVGYVFASLRRAEAS
ncbi:MAG TPA: SURF1 family protein [Steroidobacteraceae bacterium]|nr:SURF1 family protein [Steroidobacteraceae bacterium]